MTQTLLLIFLLLNIVTHATDQKNNTNEKPGHDVIENTLTNIYSQAEGNIKKKCPICLEEIEVDREVASTVCEHLFCQICMERIKENSKRCPFCNNHYFLPSHLISAIKDGKLKEAERIIRYKPSSVNQVDANNATPLMYAAFFGKQSFVKLLLHENANVEVQNNQGLTALMTAIKSMKHFQNPITFENIVKLLLEKNANVGHQEIKTEFNALHMAVLSQNEIIVQDILKNNPTSLEQMDLFGFTPLILASFFGEESMVKLLLDANANVNAQDDQGYTPLFNAIIGKNKNESCFKNNSRPTYENIVKLILLQKDVNVDHQIMKNNNLKGMTALMVAVIVRNTNIINQLIVKSSTTISQVSEKGIKALDYCFLDPYYSNIATLLIENDLSDVNRIVNLQNLWTPLFCAVIQKDENLVKLLIKNGANTNHTDKNGKSAMCHAKQKRFTNIVNLLPKRENGYFCALKLCFIAVMYILSAIILLLTVISFHDIIFL
jgi:serine/threonine-protein phosphatase 6 regulatory ankyrin repeat subunit B